MKKLFLLAALCFAATISAYSHDNCALFDSPDKKPLTITVETPGTLSQQLADYFKTEITELIVIGNLNAEDISMLRYLPNLAVLDMENVNLEALPTDAFEWKSSLTSVKLPKTLKTIGAGAFSCCSGLTSITIPDSVTEIKSRAFEDCSGLTSVTIPDSVTEIWRGAFSGCSRLKSVTIPDSMTWIADSAFAICHSLTSVTIGSGVTEIGSDAFRSCTSLTSIYCKAQTPPSVDNRYGSFNSININTITLYVPIGCKAAYATADKWKYFRIIETQF